MQASMLLVLWKFLTTGLLLLTKIDMSHIFAPKNTKKTVAALAGAFFQSLTRFTCQLHLNVLSLSIGQGMMRFIHFSTLTSKNTIPLYKKQCQQIDHLQS